MPVDEAACKLTHPRVSYLRHTLASGELMLCTTSTQHETSQCSILTEVCFFAERTLRYYSLSLLRLLALLIFRFCLTGLLFWMALKRETLGYNHGSFLHSQ